MEDKKLGLNKDEMEILYNLQYQIARNDASITNVLLIKNKVANLKIAWIEEWKKTVEKKFASEFIEENVKLQWHKFNDLKLKISKNNPTNPWFETVLEQCVRFEPYYSLGLDSDKKYNLLKRSFASYNKQEADKFMDTIFPTRYYDKGYATIIRNKI